MKKYLYGASVQGIQSFIFQTNKLKDIIGASELVKNVCDKIFKDEFLSDGDIIVTAAGNVKCIYNNEIDCINTVLKFPKRVMENSPGITISQAVVKLQDGNSESDFKAACDELEKRLQAQRSQRTKSLTTGLMTMERSRTTGFPAVCIDKEKKILDECTLSKRRALGKNNEIQLELCKDFFGIETTINEVALNFKDITLHNDWVAIIHADGNGLGEVVANKSRNHKELKDFSENLDKATKSAAILACKEIAKGKDINIKRAIRPIILGGDDMTMVCRADIALEFVSTYINSFEIETLKKMGTKLTACAGIAFIKSSYPFHYGYQLAEALCRLAKKDAKSAHIKEANNGKTPSCIMFHKVQSCFVEDFKEIEKKELTPQKDCSYRNGPYYLNTQESRTSIKALLDWSEDIAKDENNNVKTSVRKWLTDMATDKNLAQQKRERTLSLLSKEKKKLYEELTQETVRNGVAYYPAYDVLALHTVKQQLTKQ